MQLQSFMSALYSSVYVFIGAESNKCSYRLSASTRAPLSLKVTAQINAHLAGVIHVKEHA